MSFSKAASSKDTISKWQMTALVSIKTAFGHDLAPYRSHASISLTLRSGTHPMDPLSDPCDQELMSNEASQG